MIKTRFLRNILNAQLCIKKDGDMTDLTAAQKKDFAKILYLHERLTQAEIAERTGVSGKTIARWIETGGWKGLKVSITITREEQIGNIYRQLAAINDAIGKRDRGSRYATPAESDTIFKLSAAIQKMETDVGIAEIVNVSKGLLDFVRKTDIEKAKELSHDLDAYIKERMNR
jgi:transcriptional regulator with XRE-family HTH domain